MTSTAPPSSPTSRRAETGDGRRQPRPVITGITVGVDGFAGGRDAAVLGAALAEATGASLNLLAVHPAPLFSAPGWDWKTLRGEAEHALRQVRHELAPGARTSVRTGSAIAPVLQREVSRRGDGMVVVGSSRVAPVGHVRISKRTRQLLSDLPCPIAIAPHGLRAQAPIRVRRIGVGYDGSRESGAALALAGQMAARVGATLVIEAVVDDRVPTLLRAGFAGQARARWAEAAAAEQQRLKAEAERAARRTGAASSVDVDRGRPGDVLVGFSRDVDLLVIGSRHWGPASKVLLGSTGETVMHDARCPVVTVPRPGV